MPPKGGSAKVVVKVMGIVVCCLDLAIFAVNHAVIPLFLTITTRQEFQPDLPIVTAVMHSVFFLGGLALVSETVAEWLASKLLSFTGKKS